MATSAKFLASLCITFYIFLVTEAQGTCPDDWDAFEISGSCVKYFYETQLNWYDARAACQDEGGDLVKLANSTVNNAMESYFWETYTYWLTEFWIGLHYSEDLGAWVWLDEDTPAEWFNWDSGEPAVNDCGYFKSIEYDEWGGYYCDAESGYMCEIYPDAEDGEDGTVG